MCDYFCQSKKWDAWQDNIVYLLKIIITTTAAMSNPVQETLTDTAHPGQAW